MEFGLHEEFPIYAGGLGILAGDFLKAARDLGLPVVGVGLRWARGYSRQRIGDDGRPVDEFPEYSAACLTDTGARVRVRVAEREVEVRVWRTERWGNAPLLLLEPVAEEDRWITHRLYEPSLDRRVAQEILLGVGGVRALAALGLNVDTYHFNEGHAVFAGIAMIAERTAAGTGFREAWDAVRERIVFTTHTPIPAGNEVHPLGELGRLGACCGLGEAEMRAVGGDPFNMTVAGLRLSRRANAVSELHGEVSRAMWRDVEGASEILAITNGGHVPSWQDARIPKARGAADRRWAVHHTLKRELFAAVAERTGVRLDPDVLTLGFARRAAGYKRADLIFSDPARIEPLLAGRLQLVFAGKAHPDDGEGRRLVATLVAMARRYPRAVVFVPDYDMALGRCLTRGVDVWLNNPRRPLEACGTSGMKAALNGALGQPRGPRVAAQMPAPLRNCEAADREVGPLARHELRDGGNRLLDVLEERILRHRAAELVRLLDAVAEVQVVGVLEDDHALGRRRPLEELVHAGERQERVAVGDHVERRHLAAPAEVDRLAQQVDRQWARPARRRQRHRRTDAPVARRGRERRPAAEAVSRHADAVGIHEAVRTEDVVDHEAHVRRAEYHELAQHRVGVWEGAARAEGHDPLHDLEHRVSGVIHGAHHVAVTGQVRAEEGRLPAVPAVAVRERDQRMASAARRRLAHRLLPHEREAGDQVVAVARRLREVLARVLVGRGVPELDGQRAAGAGELERAHADGEWPAREGVVGPHVSPSGTW